MYFLFFVILLRDEDVCNFPNVLKNRQYQPYLQVFFAFFIERHLDKFVLLFLSLFWKLWCLLDQELNKVPGLYRTFQNARAFSESFERALLLDRCVFSFCGWQMVLVCHRSVQCSRILITIANWVTTMCTHEFLITLLKPHIFSLLFFLVIRILPWFTECSVRLTFVVLHWHVSWSYAAF